MRPHPETLVGKIIFQASSSAKLVEASLVPPGERGHTCGCCRWLCHQVPRPGYLTCLNSFMDLATGLAPQHQPRHYQQTPAQRLQLQHLAGSLARSPQLAHFSGLLPAEA